MVNLQRILSPVSKINIEVTYVDCKTAEATTRALNLGLRPKHTFEYDTSLTQINDKRINYPNRKTRLVRASLQCKQLDGAENGLTDVLRTEAEV